MLACTAAIRLDERHGSGTKKMVQSLNMQNAKKEMLEKPGGSWFAKWKLASEAVLLGSTEFLFLNVVL